MTTEKATIDVIYEHLRKETVIKKDTIGGITKVLVVRNGTFFVEEHGSTESEASRVVIETEDPSRAAHVYDSLDGTRRPWGSPWLPRGFNGLREDIKHYVFAAGTTVEDCLLGFVDSVGNLGIDKLNVEPDEDVPGAWNAYFTSGGTGFKAAGLYVPGGVIMNWWK